MPIERRYLQILDEGSLPGSHEVLQRKIREAASLRRGGDEHVADDG